MRRFLILSALLLAAHAAPTTPVAAVHAQGQSSLATAPLTHLGIVVSDIEKAVRGYADIFGMDVPAIKPISYDLPNGKKFEAKTAYVPLQNFYLQILQPTSKSGLLADHLNKYGPGVWSLGVGVDANIDAVRQELVAKGGKWTAGKKGGAYAAVDFRNSPMGTTLLIGPSARPEMAAVPTETKGLFGFRLSHVGLANTDASASVKKFVEVLGLKPNEPRRYPPQGPFPYPPNMWTDNGSVLTCMLAAANKVNIEIIQGVGEPNPWSHHIKHHGGVSIMHIAVGRAPKMSREDWLRLGQEKGGKWTNGGPPPTGTFAYLDWSESLGLVIE